MKAVTLYQPYASFVIAGIKQNETRPRVWYHTGPLAIHSAQALVWWWEELWKIPEVMAAIKRSGLPTRIEDYPFGCVLGTVTAGEMVKTDYTPSSIAQLSLLERAVGNYDCGRYWWPLSNPQPLANPLPWRGHQGLWNIPDSALAA